MIEFKRNTCDFGFNKIYTFRSGWEENWAYYLEWLKENKQIHDWEYESERYFFDKKEGNIIIRLGSYLPDFIVWDTPDKFHIDELKGKSQGMRKIQRMKKYYPNIKINLIQAKEYNEIKRKVGKMLNFV